MKTYCLRSRKHSLKEMRDFVGRTRTASDLYSAPNAADSGTTRTNQCLDQVCAFSICERLGKCKLKHKKSDSCNVYDVHYPWR